MDLGWAVDLIAALGIWSPLLIFIALLCAFLIILEYKTKFLSMIYRRHEKQKEKNKPKEEEEVPIVNEKIVSKLDDIYAEVRITNEMTKTSRTDLDKTRAVMLDIGATMTQIANTQEKIVNLMENQEKNVIKITDSLGAVAILINKLELEKENEIHIQKDRIKKLEKMLIENTYSSFVDEVITQIANLFFENKIATINIENFLLKILNDEISTSRSNTLVSSDIIARFMQVVSEHNWKNVSKLLSSVIDNANMSFLDKKGSIEQLLFAERTFVFDKLFKEF